MSLVHCILPRAGLGNQLFPLMKAQVFAYLNELPFCVTGYYRFKIGSYLRNEKSKRNYNHYFNFQKSFFSLLLERYRLKKWLPSHVIKEPELKRMKYSVKESLLFQFKEIPHWNDYFNGLREHRSLVVSLLYQMLTDQIRQKLEMHKPPCIGVHIRLGDFRRLRTDEDFSRVGAVRTPENYFIDCIRTIREINGSSLPVSIFTDGFRYELDQLLALDNISLVEGNPDIVDMLMLSRSKIIVTSAGSTFSYWAAFLADAPIIIHYDHLHSPLRPGSINQKFYEGPLRLGQPHPLMVNNIIDINTSNTSKCNAGK